MGRGRDFRGGPRRRGFDDDFAPFPPTDAGRSGPARSPGFAKPAAALPMGPPVDATVKWFNPEKGFGFVELADGSGDVFLHVAVLQSSGHETAPPGAKLKVQVGQGAKGRQVTGVLELDASTATAEPPRRGPPRPGGAAPRSGRPAPDLSTAVELSGAVKWFNGEKGFGFVQADDGGKDVFVHISVLERGGLSNLAEGQRVAMRVVEAPKGREAVSVSLA